MKKLLICCWALLPFVSCMQQAENDALSNDWNGYDNYLKVGEMVHTLWAGKNINIGTVTYGLDENANFYVTYDCSASGWKIIETHLFAGDKANMPLNRPGRPRIGRFPYTKLHHPKVTSYTYRIPLTSLPPASAPGFVVAAHAVVYHPSSYKCGYNESAWAEGSYTFSDKGWGWYDTYYYDPPQPPMPVLYGTACSQDSLRLYHIDITSGAAELILVEYVGNAPGIFDGAAYDAATGILFFTNYSTGELWLNQLQGEDSSFCAGSLAGTSASGTFYNESYYYVNQELNTINRVSFDTSWLITDEIILDTIPGAITVNDIAMSPGGETLYILGQYQENSQLIAWNPADKSFYTLSIDVNAGTQIAFGSDNELYALEPGGTCTECTYIYTIDTECGTLELVEEEIMIIDDPFTDLTSGPEL